MIVSATFYHRKSDEPWLHVPRAAFGGLTYQEKINSYASFEDQLLFEMEHASRKNISSMYNFDYSDDRFMTIRYEDLIADYHLVKFQQAFEHLGFRRSAIGWCLIIAYRNSLFSGLKASDHVRSGKPRQWPEYFTTTHRQAFDNLFGDVLAKLGYKCDAAWDQLSQTPSK